MSQRSIARRSAAVLASSLLGALGVLATPVQSAAAPAIPAAPVGPSQTACPAPGDVVPGLHPTTDELWADMTTMVGLGPRHTGYPADHQWVDYLETEMKQMGLEDVTRTPVSVLAPNPLTAAGVHTTGLKANHLHGILPGMSTKTIVLIVHSDGQNAIEENGTISLLRTMEYLTKLPKECRSYSYALVFATCHMAVCPSWEAPGWALENPAIMSRAVALVSPEHMGQRMRTATGEPGDLVPWSLWSNSETLRTRAQQMVEEMAIPRVTVHPFGIGTAFSSSLISGGDPVIGGMASPLTSFANGLTDPSIGLDFIDRAQFDRLTILFLRLTSYMDSLSVEQLRA